LGAALPALLLTSNAFAGEHREQIPIESWSFGAARSGGGGEDLGAVARLETGSPSLQLTVVAGTHSDAPSGTGKTLAAQVLAKE
jgi:hypothetical protein